MITVIAFILALKTIIATLTNGIDVPGYASTFAAVTFLGGVQLMGIGILGEYLGRTYIESKRRPPYIVKSITRV